MVSERENIQQNYGDLVMRPFNIAGNAIHAFYDSGNNLVFVLDNTVNANKPNVLLVINPVADKKWDEILSHDYNVDLENIRPKQDNKYQKLDIEYSGLSVYDNLIRAYMADDDIEDLLEQLNILRDSASRHSAMMRLDSANDIIAKTNITIVKTKETIVKLQVRIKTLRTKLSATKKEIGKVPTKQSASKILKIESQIEASNEKLKRAKKRLESAQRRLETATVDAELASDLLNQPKLESKQKTAKPVIVAPKYKIQTTDEEDDLPVAIENNEYIVSDTSDVKPLFEEDPQILNEDIAFKPISFEAPTFEAINENSNLPVIDNNVFDEKISEDIKEDIKTDQRPVIETFEPIITPEYDEPIVESKPVLETMTPVIEEPTDFKEEDVEISEHTEPEFPYVPEINKPVAPVAPIVNKSPVITNEASKESSKPTFVYYLLLFVLIILSVFTLWLYQRNVKPTAPMLAVKAPEAVVVPEPVQQPEVVKENKDDTENVFLDEIDSVDEKTETVNENTTEEPTAVPGITESTEQVTEEPEEYDEEDIAPEIIGDVPALVRTSGLAEEEATDNQVTEEEIIVNKPVYEPGNKYDDMFIDEQDSGEYVPDEQVYDMFYDEEEEQYLSGDDGYDE